MIAVLLVPLKDQRVKKEKKKMIMPKLLDRSKWPMLFLPLATKYQVTTTGVNIGEIR